MDSNNDKQVTENEVWTELSDSFRKVAHDYKDGKFDYRFVFAWFQQQQLNYTLTRNHQDQRNDLIFNTQTASWDNAIDRQ